MSKDLFMHHNTFETWFILAVVRPSKMVETVVRQRKKSSGCPTGQAIILLVQKACYFVGDLFTN